MRVPVYILAGGRSSRFGSDKARAMIHGRPLLQHVSRLLEPVASTITVVADRMEKYRDLDFHTIADLEPGLGPIAGLQTALNDLPAAEPWLMLCSCDAVVIRPPWLRALLAARTEQADAVAFRDEYWQPMPALYARTALPVVRQQIVADRRGMQQLIDRLSVTSLPTPEDWPELWQINTPIDLIRHRTETKFEPPHDG